MMRGITPFVILSITIVLCTSTAEHENGKRFVALQAVAAPAAPAAPVTTAAPVSVAGAVPTGPPGPAVSPAAAPSPAPPAAPGQVIQTRIWNFPRGLYTKYIYPYNGYGLTGVSTGGLDGYGAYGGYPAAGYGLGAGLYGGYGLGGYGYGGLGYGYGLGGYGLDYGYPGGFY